MSELPPILESLEALNLNKKIKIRAKKGEKQTRWSLFLDYYHNGKHDFTFPKIYIVGTSKSKIDDKLQLKLIQEFRDEKERQLFQDEHNFEMKNQKGKVNFIQYFENVSFEKGHLTSYHASVVLLKKFAGDKLLFDGITEKFCEDYRDFLLTQVQQITAKTYYTVFKSTLNRAVRERIIKVNPAKNFTIKAIEAKREFLTEEELRLFIASKTDKTTVKNAFIFSTQTSLRLGDIRKLKFSDVEEGYVYIRQEKTKGITRSKLSGLAQRIVNEQKRNNSESEYVFNLSKSTTHINQTLVKIGKECGIKKKLHYHMSRHTFATLCLAKGIDIYTVSKMMGHSSVAITEIYANLVSKKRDEVADLINIDIDVLNE